MAADSRFDDPAFDLDEKLSKQRDERVSPLIAVAAVCGLAAGVLLWGALAMQVLSAGERMVGDFSSASEGAPAVEGEEEGDGPIDCGELADELALSPARAAEYRQICASPTPAPSPSPTPDVRVNRADCSTIRGTDYHSADERRWYLANCVTR